MRIPVLLCVGIIVFSLLHFCPGDPAKSILGAGATEEEIEAKREYLGLNDPFLTQLGRFVYNTYIKLDLGTSYIYGVPVVTELKNRLPYTFVLAVTGLLTTLLVGIPLGINAAVHQGKWQDSLSMVVALIGVSMPGFWVGLLLVILFAVRLGWLPPQGVGGIQYYILPCLANSLGTIAGMARQTRSAMLEVIRSDYITTAKSKGISMRKVIYGHALPNALIPVITLSGTHLAAAMGGSVVIENVFSIPGVGSYMLTAVNQRDYPVVCGCVLLLSLIFTGMMLITDIVYGFVDPRIKAQYEAKSGKSQKKVRRTA
ncbi:MAG: ABC transporter permease [Oscillospiraceae bacterium]|nr:ABC transporter permease [Oscillospiraceae bacterium]